jgi:hypothetical protein
MLLQVLNVRLFIGCVLRTNQVKIQIDSIYGKGCGGGRGPHPLFLEKKTFFHPVREVAKRRSLAAANANTARKSSFVRLGKTCKISSSDIPPAIYSKML